MYTSRTMIFSSLQYFLFLPVVLFLYWRTAGSTRLAIVVLSSYAFYMSWIPVFGLLLFSLTITNWLYGIFLANLKEKGSSFAKPALVIGLAANLLVLCYYKYAGFFLTNLVDSINLLKSIIPTTNMAMANLETPELNIILPLGISFFSFEFIHYLTDVYRGEKPVTSFMEFAAFAAFFPSQIAGPIKRFEDFTVRLRNPQKLDQSLFCQGMTLIMQGLFKKLAIADPIAIVVHTGYVSAATSTPGIYDSLILIIGFLIQLYCDFSGYTDMGRGSALLMGIYLPENFNLPYLSQDITDFWRRWHISLSSWIRDYIFFPLGGSRCSKPRLWYNLIVAMGLCGLWHGAAWHYVVFGLLQGVGLIVNKTYKDVLESHKDLNNFMQLMPFKVANVIVTTGYYSLTLITLYASNMGEAFSVFSGLFNFKDQCFLLEPLLKSGAIALTSFYLLFWLLRLAIEKYPQALPKFLQTITFDQKLGYKLQAQLACWIGALIITIAARPVETIPFFYFQF